MVACNLPYLQRGGDWSTSKGTFILRALHLFILLPYNKNVNTFIIFVVRLLVIMNYFFFWFKVKFKCLTFSLPDTENATDPGETDVDSLQ